MSGIYIPGMEMPTSCAKCGLFGEYGCPFIGAVGYALTQDRRNEDCPLVHVPPHGDLIDASTKVTLQTYDDMYEEYRDEECTIADALDQWSNEGCPEVIIPADKDGAE